MRKNLNALLRFLMLRKEQSNIEEEDNENNNETIEKEKIEDPKGKND